MSSTFHPYSTIPAAAPLTIGGVVIDLSSKPREAILSDLNTLRGSLLAAKNVRVAALQGVSLLTHAE